MKRTIFFLCMITMLSGCGTSVPTEAVEGVVTLDGAPVENALVVFSAEEGGNALPAFGRTDTAGRYTAKAANGAQIHHGAMIGNYRVGITKDRPARELTPKEIEQLDATGVQPNIATISVVPKKYNDPKTSGLAAEIVKGKNRFDFELTSK